MAFDDTSTIRMIVDEIVKQKNLKYDDAIKLFYNSIFSKELSNPKSWYRTYAPQDIAKLI
jgi:hypothetical protein